MEQAKKLVIDRVFDAPVDLVWMTFSQVEYLSAWWGPKGFEPIVKNFRFEEGGTYHFGLKGPDGAIMWALFRYLEIRQPEHIAFAMSFSDESGAVCKAPAETFGAHWPLEIHHTITLEELGEQTRVRLVGVPMDKGTAEVDTFAAHIGSMEAGFRAAMERLAKMLAELSTT